jgi:hypothetical protein
MPSQKLPAKKRTMSEIAKRLASGLSERDFEGESQIAYHPPNPDASNFVAMPKDYVLVMHFSDSVSERLKDSMIITEEMVVLAFHDFQVEKSMIEN